MKFFCRFLTALCLLFVSGVYSQTPYGADSIGIAGGDNYRYFDRPINPDLYLMRPGDELMVTFINTQLDSMVLRVDPEGRIIHSTLGIFDLADKNLTEARTILSQALTKLYNVNQIAISIKKPAKVGIIVSGAVASPGLYTGYTSQRVSELIDSAGGIPPEGSRRWIVFAGGPQKLTVDLDRTNYLGDDTYNPCLYAGYSIHVPAKSSRRVQVVGEVNNPREIELTPSDSISLLLGLAGGLRSVADINNVQLIRGSKYVPASGQELKPGDMILVSAKTEENTQQKLTLYGAINQPGQYDFHPGMTLQGIIKDAGGFAENAGTNARAFIFRRAVVDQWGRVTTTRFPVTGITGDDRQLGNILLQPSDSVFVPVAVGYVRVHGAVRNPGYFPFSSSKDVAYYITAAGGFLANADRELIDIYNRVSRTTETFSPEVHIHDGDEVIVNVREELK